MTEILSIVGGFLAGMLAFHVFAERYFLQLGKIVQQIYRRVEDLEERLDYFGERFFDVLDKLEEGQE